MSGEKFITKIKDSDANDYILKGDLILRPIVSTTAGVASKLSTKWNVNTVNGLSEPYDGMTIAVRVPSNRGVTTAGTVLSIDNGTTYHPISYNVSALTTQYATNSTIILIYNDSVSLVCYLTNNVSETVTGVWQAIGDYDSNTNTIGYQLRTNSSTMTASDKFYRYRLLFTSADGTQWVPANTSTLTNATGARTPNTRKIDPFGEIVWYGTTTVIEQNAIVGATVLWQQYYSSSYTLIGYSFNNTGAAATMTANLPIYVVCTPQNDGSAIIDSTTPYTQTLPTTEDGKIYIYLGRAVTATTFEILMNHPIYWYKNGKICLYTAQDCVNTTYTFTDGTNSFTVTPSGGTAQTVNVTPSITDNALTTTSISGSVTGSTSTSDGSVGGTVGSPTVTVTKKTVTDALGYTPASDTHVHGNITNGGALQTTDITIATGDKLVVTDSSDSNKVARSSVTFDTRDTETYLSHSGTWDTPIDIHQEIDNAFDTVENPISFLVTGVACGEKSGSPTFDTGFTKPYIGLANEPTTDNAVWVQNTSTPVGGGYQTTTKLVTPKLKIRTSGNGFARIDTNGDVTASALTSSEVTTALGYTPSSTDTHVNVTGDTSTTKYLLGTSVTPSSTVQNVESVSDTSIKVNETVRSIGYKINVDANYAMICGMGIAKTANIGTSDTNTNMNMWIRAMGSNPIIGFRCSGSSQIWYFQATSTALYLGPTSSSALWMQSNGCAGIPNGFYVGASNSTTSACRLTYDTTNGGMLQLYTGNNSTKKVELKGIDGTASFASTVTVGNLIDSGLTADKWVKTDANKQLVTVDAPSDTNYYHSTGTWSGLTYTASNNGGNSCPDLSLTIPTGSTSTTVALGNHDHGYIEKDGKMHDDNDNDRVTVGKDEHILISDSNRDVRTSSISFGTNASQVLANTGNWVSLPVPPSPGTTATAVSTTSSGGSATTYSKSDHVHNITSSTITSALGFTPTSNTGTVTSVQVQATSPVQSSTSTASSTTLNTTISLASAYGDTQNPYGAKQANTILAGPASGNAANPSFRALVMGDLPIDAQTITITGTVASLTTDEIITFTGDYAQISIDDIMDNIIHPAYIAGKRIQLSLTETASSQSIILSFSYEFSFFSYIAVFSLNLDDLGTGIVAALMHSDTSTATSATAKISTSQYAVLSNVSTDITLSTSEQSLYTDLTNGVTSTIKLPATNPWGVSKLSVQTPLDQAANAWTVDMANNGYYYNFSYDDRSVGSTSTVTVNNISSTNLGSKVYFKIQNSTTQSRTFTINGTNLRGGGSITIASGKLVEFSVIVTYTYTQNNVMGLLTHTDEI